MTKSKRSRLDVFLVEQGLCASREQAQRAVMAGEVRIGDRVVSKSSVLVGPESKVSVETRSPYVGRGGFKLEGALEHFQIDAKGLNALDIGASTGGFTDCLLQRGAAKVYSIDVGHGQLAWKIRSDPRVVVREKLNARFLTRADVPDEIDLCVIDVSFISLTMILPNAFDLVTPNGLILALIKPQFELQAADVAHGGIVRDPALHEKAQNKIRHFVLNGGHRVIGMVASAITGTDGNQEFFLCARRKLA
ncbi:MAG: rRNA (cytidine1920-2-O)/16S rRNA (cytidine1409-2-O)-methyltransferase [Verrucomicrobiota bacterium]|jgi:23S rRNA (cytidine1920-2'-O)/16S rRNA (cytidine1409-2'-O)-methyltransferase